MCVCFKFLFFFFKQKTAYEMRISDWSSDVCSSDLRPRMLRALGMEIPGRREQREAGDLAPSALRQGERQETAHAISQDGDGPSAGRVEDDVQCRLEPARDVVGQVEAPLRLPRRIPVDEEWPETLVGEPAEKAAPGGKNEEERKNKRR